MSNTFPRFAGSWILTLLLLHGQENALPYPAGTATPEQIATTMRVDMRNDRAVFLQPEGDGLVPSFYQLDAGTWELTDTPSLGFFADIEVHGAVFNESREEVAVFGEDKVFFFTPNIFTAPDGDWVASNPSRSIDLPDGQRVLNVRVDGTTAAVTYAVGDLNPRYFLTIYQRDGATFWNEVVTHSIERDGPLGIEQVLLSSLAMRGDRIAVGSTVAREIRIYERDAGGPGQWNESKRLVSGVVGANIALLDDYLLEEVPSGLSKQVALYQRNQGGTNNWGVLPSPLILGGPGRLFLDSDGDRLLVMSTSETASSGATTVRAHVLIPGGGPGWETEAEFDIGTTSGALLGAVAVHGDEAIFGLPTAAYEGSGRWTAAVYRRTGNWGFVQTISDEGSADGIESVIDYRNGLIAVGNPQDNWAGTSSGSVLVYQVRPDSGSSGQTLIPVARLESPDPEPGERFGAAVSIREGTYVAVGAPGHDGNKGRVYVFRLTVPFPPFLEGDTQLLTAIDAPESSSDFFGTSVSVLRTEADNDVVVAVGAPFNDAAGTDAGAVYLYEKDRDASNDWGLRKRITRPSILNNKQFGWQAVLMEDRGTARLAVSTQPAGSGAPGEVAIFNRSEGGFNAWGIEDNLFAPPEAPSGFAQSLAASATMIAVGAPSGDGSAGRAYVYQRVPIGWVVSKEVIGSPNDGASFGATVSVSDYQFAVGAPDSNTGSGRLSVFGGLPRDPANWLLHYTRAGLSSEALGSGVGSDAIYTAVIEGGEIDLWRAGSYEVWAKSQGFGIGENWFPEQNADGDPDSNLVEFALGTDPMNPSSSGAITITPGTFTGLGGPAPAMQWREPVLPYSTLLLAYSAETSVDLKTWQGQRISYTSDGGVRVQNYLLDPASTTAFYRIRPLYPLQLISSGILP